MSRNRTISRATAVAQRQKSMIGRKADVIAETNQANTAKINPGIKKT